MGQILLLLILAYRLGDLGDVVATEALLALGVTGLVIFVSVLGVVTVFHRRMRRATAHAGPGGWAASSADPDDPQRWQALLVDAAGVRSADRSGAVRREWTWESIGEVRVERFSVGLMTRPGVVLYLTDGSRAEILLSSPVGFYTAARAETAAHEIGQRLAAFQAQSTPSETPSR